MPLSLASILTEKVIRLVTCTGTLSDVDRETERLQEPVSMSPRFGSQPCEYVLLAEFDIDEGSVLRHEYPVPTGCDEQ